MLLEKGEGTGKGSEMKTEVRSEKGTAKLNSIYLIYVVVKWPKKSQVLGNQEVTHRNQLSFFLKS